MTQRDENQLHVPGQMPPTPYLLDETGEPHGHPSPHSPNDVLTPGTHDQHLAGSTYPPPTAGAGDATYNTHAGQLQQRIDQQQHQLDLAQQELDQLRHQLENSPSHATGYSGSEPAAGYAGSEPAAGYGDAGDYSDAEDPEDYSETEDASSAA